MSEYFTRFYCNECEVEILHEHKEGIFTCMGCGKGRLLGDVMQGSSKKYWKEREGSKI